jgi:hypothetical protein
MSEDPHSWLDKYIQEQSDNRKIMESIAVPYSPAELQEMAEREEWKEGINDLQT